MITSSRNERVLAAIRLHRRRHRRESGRTLVEGPIVLGEAVRAGATIVDGFHLEDDAAGAALVGDVGTAVAPRVLNRIAATEHPRGPVAVVEIPDHVLSGRDTMVLVGVREPGNAGTIVRSAAAFGFDVAATPGTVDLWSPKVLRAGAGAHFHTPVVELDDNWPAVLARAGLETVALVASGGSDSSETVPVAIALLVGEEAAGLPEEVVEACDHVVTLAMPGVAESLNAAIAASIAMYERMRAQT